MLTICEKQAGLTSHPFNVIKPKALHIWPLWSQEIRLNYRLYFSSKPISEHCLAWPAFRTSQFQARFSVQENIFCIYQLAYQGHVAVDVWQRTEQLRVPATSKTPVPKVVQEMEDQRLTSSPTTRLPAPTEQGQWFSALMNTPHFWPDRSAFQTSTHGTWSFSARKDGPAAARRLGVPQCLSKAATWWREVFKVSTVLIGRGDWHCAYNTTENSWKGMSQVRDRSITRFV